MSPTSPGQRISLAPVYVLLAASMWGTTGVAAKFLYAANSSPLLLAAARVMLAWVIIGFYLLITSRPSFRVVRRDVLHLAVFGFFGVALCQFFYLFSVTQANVGVAVLLQSLAPAFAYIYSLFVRSEKFQPMKVAALTLALSGGVIVVHGSGGWGGAISPLGLLSGVCSGLCWAFYGLRAKTWLGTYSPWTLLFWGNGFATLTWWLILSPGRIINWLATTPNAYSVVFYLAIMCTVIPAGLYLKGVRALMPSTAGIIGTFEPLAASLFAFLLLHETLSSLQMAGGVVILAALILLQNTTVSNEVAENTSVPRDFKL